MIETARKINEYIPKNIATKIIKHLDGKLSPKILISGFAFKGNPPTSDIRFSPTLDLLKCLEGFGYDIYGWDAIVPKEEIEKLGVKLIKERMDFDVIVVMNNHPLNRQELLNGNGCLLIDPWNLYDTLV
jgi:UDP-N-acetyl-D-mannosaminuronic acid dehydrogenase